jgi:hypothetical protein
MIAVDDGLTSGNLNFADVMFLIGAIVAVLAAIFYGLVQPPVSRWAPVMLSLAVGFVAFGFFVL